MTTLSTPLDYALAYTARGWRVAPIAPGTKHPRLDAWERNASKDPDVAAKLWRDDDGVGIVTGVETGLFVVDVDVSDGKRGDETLADLEHEHGPLPDTVSCITGSGGRHYYFAMPAGVVIYNSAGAKLGPGLDVRGEGGQVVAPPTVHPKTKRRYEWDVDHDPLDGAAVAEAPAWLIELLTAEAPAPAEARRERSSSGRDPGDVFAAAKSWPDLLLPDGATLASKRNGRHGYYELWTRPGKPARDGGSATLYYGGTDLLKVFTSSWHGLDEGQTYTKFGYFAATRHRGDYRAAARDLAAQGYGEARGVDLSWMGTSADAPTEEAAVDAPRRSPFIDWSEFWAKDHGAEEWLVKPLIPAGRSVSIAAPGGTGKSLVSLSIAAAVAAGRPVLGLDAEAPRSVLYLDYEMTESDLAERLEAMGYGPGDDLSRLHYWLLPSIGPLNTPVGAAELVGRAADVGAELVVIDTLSRAVSGEENDAAFILDFYRLTVLPLKAAGRAVLRLDHTGKDFEKGARGTSAKRDDIDVGWLFSATDGGITARATKRRVGWVPEMVQLTKRDEDVLEWIAAPDVLGWPAGTAEVAARLDALGMPVETTRWKACEALAEAGEKRRVQVVSAAVRYRKQRARNDMNMHEVSGSRFSGTTHSGGGSGTTPEPQTEMPSGQPGTTREPREPRSSADVVRGGGDCKEPPRTMPTPEQLPAPAPHPSLAPEELGF